MGKQQIILIIVGLILVALIYQLPRVVVENDQVTEVEPHATEVSNTDNEVIISLRNQLAELTDIKKSIKFADSLARTFLKYQEIDSTEKYADYILNLESSDLAKYTAAMIYYEAFQGTMDEQQVVRLASKAEKHLSELLEKDPENMYLKNKVAMTMITTANPMQGVMVLREILEKEPENREAIFNLGLLAIRSGQLDKAEERFQRLLSIDENDQEALFYLGVVFAESEKNDEAIEAFEKYLNHESRDPALQAMATNYIKELKSIK